MEEKETISRKNKGVEMREGITATRGKRGKGTGERLTAKRGVGVSIRKGVGSGVSLQRLAVGSADDAEGKRTKTPEGFEAGLAVFFAD